MKYKITVTSVKLAVSKMGKLPAAEFHLQVAVESTLCGFFPPRISFGD